MFEWPDLMFPVLNLPILGPDPRLIPKADCENCNYNVTSYKEATEQWCYMFEKSPGERCGQFKKLRTTND